MTDLLTIAELVDSLTNPIEVREPYQKWHGNNRRTYYHEHRMPSLIDQLRAASIPGEVYVEDEAGHITRMPQSCPPARIDAINLSLAIDVGAANWTWRCRLTVREDTASNLRCLVGAQIDSDTRTQMQRDLGRWLHSALIVAGWERPPYRPPAPCPFCNEWGLRVRLDKETAVCVNCHETWDAVTIRLLGEHVAATTRQGVVAPTTSAAIITPVSITMPGPHPPVRASSSLEDT